MSCFSRVPALLAIACLTAFAFAFPLAACAYAADDAGNICLTVPTQVSLHASPNGSLVAPSPSALSMETARVSSCA